ncbi:MAG: MipA/OmpV family protein [Rhizobiaceae bacterium]
MKNNLLMSMAIAASLASGLTTIGVAQDYGTSVDAPQTGPQYVIRLGAGGLYKPKFAGASEYLLSPFPIIKVDRLYLPGFGQVVDGSVKTSGFSVYPSFSVIGERSASDSNDLTGTNKVDFAVEAGFGVRYRHDWLQGFAEIRQGFGGHEGQVGRLGLDVITQPTEQLELVFGPRVNWGSDNYTRTYFGVTAAEAAAAGSVLTAFRPGSGITSYGVDLQANYAYTEKTTLHFRAGWDRFVGDAADSPIVKRGNEDQFSVGLGLSYRFDFDLFE